MVYRVLDHTADTGAELAASSLEELFAEALRAFTDTVTVLAGVRPREEHELRVEAPDLELLLVEWLEELIYAFEVRGLLFHHAVVTLEGGEGTHRLVARAWGETVDPARHPVKVLVKAITLHGLFIRPTDRGFEGRVIFDI